MQLNKVMLMGYLCADPELRSTNSGTSVLGGRIAVTHTHKKTDGDKVEDTVFMSFTIWGSRGESFAKFHKKGDLVYIEGRLKDDSWTKDDGTKVAKISIHVSERKFAKQKNPDAPRTKLVDEAF